MPSPRPARRRWAAALRRRTSGALAGHVGHPAPRGLGRQLDRLAAAVGLDVREGVRRRVEGDVELALLDALVEPRRPEDEPAQPVDERAVRRADELGPAVVDVLAQTRARVRDLAVDRQVDEVLQLGVAEPAADEAELHPGLLAALGEVALVEREAQLAVFEDEFVTGVVLAALR